MICKECQAQGLKSTITLNFNIATAAHYPAYYDENGLYHNHDWNKTTSCHTCSNGHDINIVQYKSCWCGWTNDPNKENK